MRLRRRLPVIAIVLLVVAAVLVAVVLRKHAPPEPARLLPSADGFVYMNFSWMRRGILNSPMPEVPHDPDYEQFIQATGFQFERDLDEAAFAVHYPVAYGPSENRFSEVFTGKFDGERLRAYLQKISTSTESYNSRDIYSIPLEGRTLRVSILGVDTVAASNHPDPQVIRGIVDRSRKLASPFGGPALLRQFYKHVQLASIAWGIFRVGPSSDGTSSANNSGTSDSGMISNLSFLFRKPAVVVASVRYLANVHLRAEAFTASDEDAKALTEEVATFLSMFHAAENSVGTPAPDQDVKMFFESLKVEQHGDRGVLTASIPLGFIRKAISEAPAAAQPPTAIPPPTPSKPHSRR
jgi:hypothetical protein